LLSECFISKEHSLYIVDKSSKI